VEVGQAHGLSRTGACGGPEGVAAARGRGLGYPRGPMRVNLSQPARCLPPPARRYWRAGT
jgi:hypothetical protein